jgi:hypothetical protein
MKENERSAMVHVVIMSLIGFFVAFTLALLLSPSGDPYTAMIYGIPLFTILESFYWVGYVRGSRCRKPLGEG